MLGGLEPALPTDVKPFDCVQLLCGDDLKVTEKLQPGFISSLTFF